MKQWLSFGAAALTLTALTLTAEAGGNFVRNGGFDRPWGWNNRPIVRPSTPFEGWHWSGSDKAPVATSGRIELNAPGTLRNTHSSAVPAREYVLVFDVKTTGAKGGAFLELLGRTLLEAAKPVPADAPWTFSEFLDSARNPIPAKYRQVVVTSPRVALPADTGGKYFRAQDEQALRQVYQEIDQLEKSKIRVHQYRQQAELFTTFLGLALLLLLIEVILSSTRLRKMP